MSANEKFFVTGDHLTDEDYVNLTLLSEDQIAYGKLSDPVLSRLALSSELYIATSSLGELDLRNSSSASEVAATILLSDTGDAHLKALAFRILFERDPKRAIAAVHPLIALGDPILVSEVARELASCTTLPDDQAARELAGLLIHSLLRSDRPMPEGVKERVITALERFAQ